MRFRKIAISFSLAWVLISGTGLGAIRIEDFPAPYYPSSANALRWAGTASLRLTVQDGELSQVETLSYDFYETRIRSEGSQPVVRRLNKIYPQFFRESIENAIHKWKFIRRSFQFEVDFTFELEDRENNHNQYQQCLRIEVQEFDNFQILVPKRVVITARRLGPDVHRDF